MKVAAVVVAISSLLAVLFFRWRQHEEAKAIAAEAEKRKRLDLIMRICTPKDQR